jgi:hypothetical protein
MNKSTKFFQVGDIVKPISTTSTHYKHGSNDTMKAMTKGDVTWTVRSVNTYNGSLRLLETPQFTWDPADMVIAPKLVRPADWPTKELFPKWLTDARKQPNIKADGYERIHYWLYNNPDPLTITQCQKLDDRPAGCGEVWREDDDSCFASAISMLEDYKYDTGKEPIWVTYTPNFVNEKFRESTKARANCCSVGAIRNYARLCKEFGYLPQNTTIARYMESTFHLNVYDRSADKAYMQFCTARYPDEMPGLVKSILYFNDLGLNFHIAFALGHFFGPETYSTGRAVYNSFDTSASWKSSTVNFPYQIEGQPALRDVIKMIYSLRSIVNASTPEKRITAVDGWQLQYHMQDHIDPTPESIREIIKDGDYDSLFKIKEID